MFAHALAIHGKRAATVATHSFALHLVHAYACHSQHSKIRYNICSACYVCTTKWANLSDMKNDKCIFVSTHVILETAVAHSLPLSLSENGLLIFFSSSCSGADIFLFCLSSVLYYVCWHESVWSKTKLVILQSFAYREGEGERDRESTISKTNISTSGET